MEFAISRMVARLRLFDEKVAKNLTIQRTSRWDSTKEIAGYRFISIGLRHSSTVSIHTIGLSGPDQNERNPWKLFSQCIIYLRANTWIRINGTGSKVSGVIVWTQRCQESLFDVLGKNRT